MVEEKGQTIQKCCLDLFQKKGLRRVSIEDIVRESNLSKKELYEQFENKEGVIRSVLIQDLEEIKLQLEQVKEEADNAIEEMTNLHNFYSQRYSQVNPVLFFDLNKYYTQIAKQVHEDRCAFNENFINHNLRRGQEEGLYRTDFNEDIVIMLWKLKIETIKNQILYDGGSVPIFGLAQEITELHLRSIASELGMKYMNEQFRSKIQ